EESRALTFALVVGHSKVRSRRPPPRPPDNRPPESSHQGGWDRTRGRPAHAELQDDLPSGRGVRAKRDPGLPRRADRAPGGCRAGGGWVGGRAPAGGLLMSAPPAATAGGPAANPRRFIGPLEAGESDNELVGVRREDRADGSAGAGSPRLLGHAVRLMAAA